MLAGVAKILSSLYINSCLIAIFNYNSCCLVYVKYEIFKLSVRPNFIFLAILNEQVTICNPYLEPHLFPPNVFHCVYKLFAISVYMISVSICHSHFLYQHVAFSFYSFDVEKISLQKILIPFLCCFYTPPKIWLWSIVIYMYFRTMTIKSLCSIRTCFRFTDLIH